MMPEIASPSQTAFSAYPFIPRIYNEHSYKPSTELGAKRGPYIRHGPSSWGSSGQAGETEKLMSSAKWYEIAQHRG